MTVSFDPTAKSALACLLAGDDEDDDLETLLTGHGIDVFGVARTGVEALRILEQRPRTVIVVDSRLEDLDWLEVARRATEIVRNQTFVVLRTDGADSRAVARGLDAGARGIVLRTASHSTLLQACSSAASGGIYVDPALT